MVILDATMRSLAIGVFLLAILGVAGAFLYIGKRRATKIEQQDTYDVDAHTLDSKSVFISDTTTPPTDTEAWDQEQDTPDDAYFHFPYMDTPDDNTPTLTHSPGNFLDEYTPSPPPTSPPSEQSLTTPPNPDRELLPPLTTPPHQH